MSEINRVGYVLFRFFDADSVILWSHSCPDAAHITVPGARENSQVANSSHFQSGNEHGYPFIVLGDKDIIFPSDPVSLNIFCPSQQLRNLLAHDRAGNFGPSRQNYGTPGQIWDHLQGCFESAVHDRV